MNGDKSPSTALTTENGFYTGKETSTGEIGTSGMSRKILHGITIISVLTASICTIYGSVQAESAVLVLPFLIVILWLFIHCSLLFFANHDQHDFHPPPWFVFVSSGHIFMQSLVVIILTLFKKQT